MTGFVRDGARPAPARRLLRRWPALTASAVVVVTFADGVPPVGRLAGLLVAMPVCYLLFGAFRGELRGFRVPAVQFAGLAGFAAVAALALSLDAASGLRVVAAGWLAHGVWDLVHHRSGRVVPRAWSEWCGVVDVGGALAILILA
ncbi:MULTISPECIES: hypothetical protein [Streptomyces]|uniref:Uncharacterized protein n=1 Tax=Streptomyces sudanensis TaxID=436397 RepID=A0ABY4TFM4_9ACTN|nr:MULTISPECIES: hypothetical protein [Streptomyces]MCP9957141.1 hypothetical protein [Streptomyces sudanensis]MCP9986312.1 hypothetical protein [Streptomyces sudanensis]MCQ0002286.1 hypothetical protein [Streptomyces sudanensis]URN17727.1 hypothetical protein MW084_19290 [Streptomyces sudanensis]